MTSFFKITLLSSLSILISCSYQEKLNFVDFVSKLKKDAKEISEYVEVDNTTITMRGVRQRACYIRLRYNERKLKSKIFKVREYVYPWILDKRPDDVLITYIDSLKNLKTPTAIGKFLENIKDENLLAKMSVLAIEHFNLIELNRPKNFKLDIIVKGYADGYTKDFEASLIAGYDDATYKNIEHLKPLYPMDSINQFEYMNETITRVIGQKYKNADLPYLRASFIKNRFLNGVSDEHIRSIYIAGQELPKRILDSTYRFAEMYIIEAKD